MHACSLTDMPSGVSKSSVTDTVPLSIGMAVPNSSRNNTIAVTISVNTTSSQSRKI